MGGKGWWVAGRSDEARTSHTQTLEMGRGHFDWYLGSQTSEQLLETRCLARSRCLCIASVRVCACACNVCLLHVVFEMRLYCFLLCCFGRLAR